MDRLLFEYVWLIGSSPKLQSKIKLIEITDLTEFETTEDPQFLPELTSNEHYLHPVRVATHPFYSPGYIVFCEVLNASRNPYSNNMRHFVTGESLAYEFQESRFSQKQKYDLKLKKGSVSARHIAEEHMNACIAANLDICEVEVGSFELAHLSIIDAGDQLWLARWILQRVAEKFDLVVKFDPEAKLDIGFSTGNMRQPGGLALHIEPAIAKLNSEHVKIPLEVKYSGHGYFLDKSQPADVDPYSACFSLLKTVCSN